MEELPETQYTAQEPRIWQVGDLVSSGHPKEKKLIIEVLKTGSIVTVAENGRWNLYEIYPGILIDFLHNTGLDYVYQNREQAQRDYQAGFFTPYFEIL